MCNIDNLITTNQTNMPLEVLKALLSGGTKNEDTKQETRVSEQSGCLRARARSPTQGGGLSLREIKFEKRDTTLFYSYKEALSCTLETHSQGQNPHMLVTTA